MFLESRGNPQLNKNIVGGAVVIGCTCACARKKKICGNIENGMQYPYRAHFGGVSDKKLGGYMEGKYVFGKQG